MYEDDVPFVTRFIQVTLLPDTFGECGEMIGFTFSYQSCKYGVTRPAVEVKKAVKQ